MRFLILFFVLNLFLSFAVGAEVYKVSIPAPRSHFDVSHDYHVQLLQAAIAHSGEEVSLEFVQVDKMSQGRAEVELEKDQTINLYWFGASKELDEKLEVIPIPTTRGLIGLRKFFVHKSKVTAFDKVNTVKDLKKLIACQGRHWPDTKILNNVGLDVTASTDYETLFKMLNLNRCDYFPRGIHDFLTELDLRRSQYRNVSQYNRILLHYPFAVYFYTNKQHKDWANVLTIGMEKLAKTGGILKLMKTHPLTKDVFINDNAMSQKLISIPNPYLSPGPYAGDKRFWFKPSEFIE